MSEREAEALPPPSAALQELVRDMKPVTLRRPRLAFLFVAAVFVADALVFLLKLPLRRDFAALPQLWWFGVAAIWLASASVGLWFAVVPRRRTVLPDGVRAAYLAGWLAIVLLALGLFFTCAATPATIVPATFSQTRHALFHCLGLAIAMAALPLALSLYATRRVLKMGGARVGALLGAATGALSGLLLHAICPIGGGVHVGFAHGGGVAVCALVGAALAAAFGRMSR